MSTLYTVIEDNELIQVAGVDSGEMYSWSTTEIYFQRSSGRFFALSGSGCSCNSFGDNVGNLADLNEVTRAQAIQMLKDEAESAYDALAADDVQREVAKVRDFR